jgi:hypothetical protein
VPCVWRFKRTDGRGGDRIICRCETECPEWAYLRGAPLAIPVSNLYGLAWEVVGTVAIAADPCDAGSAPICATVMGFNVPRVYRSTNLGVFA